MGRQRGHWDSIYDARDEASLTWFEAGGGLSRQLIWDLVEPGDPIIDIGAGASRLVDGLLQDGLGPVSILDVSASGLECSRLRLGALAGQVTWIEADITQWKPSGTYGLWHDRAVFHFLVEASDRAAYLAALAAAVKPGGAAVIATFDEAGPESCAGLPVRRYSPLKLAETIEAGAPELFQLVDSRQHMHQTPLGRHQSFQISVFHRTERTARSGGGEKRII